MTTFPKPVTIALLVASLALVAAGGLFFARSRCTAPRSAKLGYML